MYYVAMALVNCTGRRVRSVSNRGNMTQTILVSIREFPLLCFERLVPATPSGWEGSSQRRRGFN